MPWRGLKAGSADTDARRRSILVDIPLGRRSEQLSRKRSSLDDPSPITSGSAGPSPLGLTEQTHSVTGGTDNLPDASNVRLEPVKRQQTPKTNRFSLLRFRHASDPQLSSSYATADNTPPVPTIPPPTIITTSPTMGQMSLTTKQRKSKFLQRSPNSSLENVAQDHGRLGIAPSFRRNHSSPAVHSLRLSKDRSRKPHISFENPTRSSTTSLHGLPPPEYGDESNSSLALPITRLSESSRSDGSSGEHGIYATTTTTHTIHTTTTFFRLPRRKKDKGPLFPLPVKISPPTSTPVGTHTPRASVSGRNSESPGGPSPIANGSRSRSNTISAEDEASPLPSPSHSLVALTNAPLGTPGPGIVRKDSTTSHRSGRSIPAMGPPPFLGHRDRSQTMGSFTRDREANHTPSGSLVPSGRNSTSTTGRKSFGDLFSLSNRLRQNSEPPEHGSPGGLPGTPGSSSSKPNSFSIPRESLVYPARTDEDTPAGYLSKLEAAVNRGVIASILCKGADDFSTTCLRKYMRGFSYFGDSLDIAVRKMLMEVELPKETQQIDRLLQGFANRYCECNPGIFASTDEAYFVAFSILLLHSDTHNKNNKRKMQKPDYVKNTQDQVEVSHHILECFYDNVSYTPFIHFDDEVAINSHRLAGSRSRKNLFRAPSSDALKGQLDPYALILENKLEFLRPPIKDVMNTEDTYSATGSAESLDVDALHQAFLKSGVLQIVSARSRPDAFLTPATITNPADAQVGLVDIKAAKVGLLWRKDPKKKKARSPWQEWGALLTSSQLYFFRDLTWVKALMTQHQNHYKNGNDAHPVIFRPPLTEFKPDALISMDDSVALLDSAYKKHKYAFTFIKHGGFEEVFLANDEGDMNDWIAKLNYAATFRTAGIRMRGLTGATFEGRRRSITRANSAVSERTIPTATGDVHFQSRKLDQNMAQEIMTYRRQLMLEKINDANERLGLSQKGLEKLLRNARHLQVQTPIQQRTRDALLIAAANMSANLKWTRVEIWRTKCHRDVLQLDLDEEEKRNSRLLGREPSVHVTSPHRTSTGTNQAALARLESASTGAALSPKSTKSEGHRGIPTVNIARSITPEPLSLHQTSLVGKRSSHGSIEQSAAASAASADLRDDFITPQSSPNVHDLSHKPSTISSRSRSEVTSISNVASRLATPTKDGIEDGEEQILREAGLIGAEGTAPTTIRPDTSESEKDRTGTVSPETTPIDRSKVRRSLHRTLRDSQGPHIPSTHRSRKGRDSAQSFGTVEDSVQSASKDGAGLTRGTGSIIVHGKKASVITFGQDWSVLSPEERLKMKKEAQRASVKSTMEGPTESSISLPLAGVGSGREGSCKSLETSSVTGASEVQSEHTHEYMNRDSGNDLDHGLTVGDQAVSNGKQKALVEDLSVPSSPEMQHSPMLQPVQA